tara:strand:- start:252 stop:467 length:216 start_codon:yes stop_codon:yes gene_type:complete
LLAGSGDASGESGSCSELKDADELELYEPESELYELELESSSSSEVSSSEASSESESDRLSELDVFAWLRL